jgi:CRP-like cAMP-binding protein/Na+/melibiose symporter-like transporter
MTAAPVDLLAKPPSPYSVFRRRDFRLMWIGQFVSTAGTALTSLAASILVYRLTGSALSVGLMMIATAAPSLLVGLFAGVIVDRYDRKRIMVVTELLRAVLIALIPFLAAQHIAWLYVIVALTSAIAQFYDPAHESVLPEVAPEKELAAANSLITISSFGSTAIGFAASGLIASAANIDWAFYIDAVSFLLSALCIALITVKPLDADEEASAAMVVRNLRVGLRFLADTPILRSLFIVYVPVLLSFGLSNSLLLPFSDRALGATEFQYGIQEALTSVAFVACSLIMAGIFERMREGQWIALSWLAMGVLTMIYARLTSIPLAMVVIALSGFANAPSAIGGRLILQRNTPREMRGRVNSAFFVARDIVFLVGMGLAGLADVIDVRTLFLLSGVILTLGGLLVLLLPGLRDDAAAWKRSMALLRGAPAAPRLGAGRAAQAADADTIVDLIPTLCNLSARERDVLAAHAVVIGVPSGTAIVRRGEKSDKAYFIMAGRAVAGFEDTDGSFRVLNPLLAGDFFGEIAALTGSARTADVVADENVQIMQVPAATLREMMSNAQFSSLVLETMTSRLNVVSSTVLPRFAALDQSDLRDLRTNAAEAS